MTEAKVKVGKLGYAFRKSQRQHDVERTEQRGEASRLQCSLGKNVRKIESLFGSINGLRTTHHATIARNKDKEKVGLVGFQYLAYCSVLLFDCLFILLFSVTFCFRRCMCGWQRLSCRGKRQIKKKSRQIKKSHDKARS